MDGERFSKNCTFTAPHGLYNVEGTIKIGQKKGKGKRKVRKKEREEKEL